MPPSPPDLALPPRFIGLFPKLQADVTAITAPESDVYNCLAWALGITHQWWWPVGKAVWENGIGDEESVETCMRLFIKRGYVDCDNADLEDGFVKIAIYVKERRPTHFARQLPDGQWTSKLGEGPCITHRTLQSLEGDLYEGYGRVEVVMKRKA